MISFESLYSIFAKYFSMFTVYSRAVYHRGSVTDFHIRANLLNKAEDVGDRGWDALHWEVEVLEVNNIAT